MIKNLIESPERLQYWSQDVGTVILAWFFIFSIAGINLYGVLNDYLNNAYFDYGVAIVIDILFGSICAWALLSIKTTTVAMGTSDKRLIISVSNAVSRMENSLEFKEIEYIGVLSRMHTYAPAWSRGQEHFVGSYGAIPTTDWKYAGEDMEKTPWGEGLFFKQGREYRIFARTKRGDEVTLLQTEETKKGKGLLGRLWGKPLDTREDILGVGKRVADFIGVPLKTSHQK